MGPQVDTAAPPKRSMLRRILWAIVIGGGALILINALLPDLDLSGQDRVALIRVEGVILDAQATISELKHYSENPLVKAIVLRIDSPGGRGRAFPGDTRCREASEE
jgi:protease-4